MSSGAASGETLEVFNYTWPPLLRALAWSAMIAIAAPVLLLGEPHVRDWLEHWLGSWLFPLAIGLAIYALAGIAIARGLSERFNRPRMRPSFVADRAGLTTQWSVRVPWRDVTTFVIGHAAMARYGDHTVQYPSVLVSNIRDYRRRSWLYSRWEPANALPMVRLSPAGYLVRRGATGPLDRLDDQQLLAELSRFRSRIAQGGNAWPEVAGRV